MAEAADLPQWDKNISTLFQASLLPCMLAPLGSHHCSPGPTCALCQGLAGGEVQSQGAVVPRVSQHVQGWLHLVWLVHGADVVREDVADLARSCHQALCQETTVSPGPMEVGGPAAAAPPGPGWVRPSSPSLHPSSPLRSNLQKHPPSTRRLGLGPDSPPPRGRERGRLSRSKPGTRRHCACRRAPSPAAWPHQPHWQPQQAGGLQRMALDSPSSGDEHCRALSRRALPQPHSTAVLGLAQPAAHCRDSSAGSSSPLNQLQEARPSNSAARRGPSPCPVLVEEPNLPVRLTKSGGWKGRPLQNAISLAPRKVWENRRAARKDQGHPPARAKMHREESKAAVLGWGTSTGPGRKSFGTFCDGNPGSGS